VTNLTAKKEKVSFANIKKFRAPERVALSNYQIRVLLDSTAEA
jgi:hypothetical protein